MFHVISAACSGPAACSLGSCKHARPPGPGGAEAGRPSAALTSGKGLYIYILLYLMWAALAGTCLLLTGSSESSGTENSIYTRADLSTCLPPSAS